MLPTSHPASSSDGPKSALRGARIVYTSTVQHAEVLRHCCAPLASALSGITGRLRARERHDTRERFVRGEARSIVATNDFEMAEARSAKFTEVSPGLAARG